MPIKVLVVDDDENTRISLRLALEADGYIVAGAKLSISKLMT